MKIPKYIHYLGFVVVFSGCTSNNFIYIDRNSNYQKMEKDYSECEKLAIESTSTNESLLSEGVAFSIIDEIISKDKVPAAILGTVERCMNTKGYIRHAVTNREIEKFQNSDIQRKERMIESWNSILETK